MKFKRKASLLIGMLCLTVFLSAQNVCVSTPKTSLVLSAPVGGKLQYVYYGEKLQQVDWGHLKMLPQLLLLIQSMD